MTYSFICPNCGKKYDIQMPISKYQDEGHMCECGTELKRDPKSFNGTFIVKCDGFCGKTY